MKRSEINKRKRAARIRKAYNIRRNNVPELFRPMLTVTNKRAGVIADLIKKFS